MADPVPDPEAEHALRRYLRLVAEQFGVGLESCWYEWLPRPTAYLALDLRPPGHTHAWLALLWDAHAGWALGTEADGDFTPVAGYPLDILPAPRVVAAFVTEILNTDDPPPLPSPPPPPAATPPPDGSSPGGLPPNLRARLLAYLPPDDITHITPPQQYL